MFYIKDTKDLDLVIAANNVLRLEISSPSTNEFPPPPIFSGSDFRHLYNLKLSNCIYGYGLCGKNPPTDQPSDFVFEVCLYSPFGPIVNPSELIKKELIYQSDVKDYIRLLISAPILTTVNQAVKNLKMYSNKEVILTEIDWAKFWGTSNQF